MMEIAPIQSNGEPFLYSIEVKRDFRNQVRYHIPPRLPEKTLRCLERYSLAAYRLLGCRDIARIDFRLDAQGSPHFIECNPLPGLNPETSDIVILSRDTKSYEELIQGILRDARARY
jgi:D-alanine-D-alanine ligase